MKVNAMSFAKLIKYLEEGVYSRAELAEKTGLHPTTVGDYCKALQKEGVVHVTGWEQDTAGRWSIQVLGLGSRPNAKKPPAIPKAEIKRAYDKRKRHVETMFKMAA